MGYLRQVDKSAALVKMLFMASRETADEINQAKIHLLMNFWIHCFLTKMATFLPN